MMFALRPIQSAAVTVRRLLGVILVALLLAGCASGAGPAPGQARPVLELPTAEPTVAPSPVSTRVLPVDSLTPAPSPTITPIPGEARGMVVDVIDGNTLAVVLDGDPMALSYEVRLLGIDAPPNLSTDPWGVVAAETSAALANLKVVRLVRDETDFDDDGYLLRYVYVGSDLLNAQLVERGLARVDIAAPDDRLETTLRAAETKAKEEELGIWGSEPPTPTPERMPQAATAEPITATTTITAPATVIATVAPTATTVTTATVTPAATTGSPAPQQTPTRTPTLTATPTEAAAPESDDLQGPSN
ncbi:MAG: hypothetical protein Kow0031_32140 [Anaerolineae bacterium]